jgi:hypothetical protein
MNSNPLQASLLRRIAAKGGLHGQIAQLYISDMDAAHEYLTECFGHCHNQSVWAHWGKELTLDIIHYRILTLRHDFERIFGNKQAHS